MFARVTRMTASAEWVEDGIASITERAPSTQGQHGLRGAYWLIDRENGQGLAITFWDTEEGMRASEPMGEDARAQTAQSVSGRVLSGECVWEGDMERDPVCGTELMPDKEEAEFQYQGKTYRFCSRECRDLFANNPTENVKAGSEA